MTSPQGRMSGGRFLVPTAYGIMPEGCTILQDSVSGVSPIFTANKRSSALLARFNLL